MTYQVHEKDLHMEEGKRGVSVESQLHWAWLYQQWAKRTAMKGRLGQKNCILEPKPFWNTQLVLVLFDSSCLHRRGFELLIGENVTMKHEITRSWSTYFPSSPGGLDFPPGSLEFNGVSSSWIGPSCEACDGIPDITEHVLK